MAFELLNTVWSEELQLPAATRLVLARLADRANSDGLAWPSVATLARDVGLSIRQTQRHLRRLEQLGFIRVHRKATHIRPTVYRVLPPRLAADIDHGLGGDNDDANRVTSSTPKPSVQPSRTEKAGRQAPDRLPVIPVEPGSMGLLTKMAHEALDLWTAEALIADIAYDLKALCIQRRIHHHPDQITAAIESARFQRRHRREHDAKS